MKRFLILCMMLLSLFCVSGCHQQTSTEVLSATEAQTKPVTSEATTTASTTEEMTTQASVVEKEFIDYMQTDGTLELPVQGATGFASVPMNIMTDASTGAEVIGSLAAGDAFTILQESEEWWQIEANDVVGWVCYRYCFINLPDVIPSIVYYDTNAFSSAFLSSGKELPGISGLQLYEAYGYNERLGREEYIVPVLYSMAFKICVAQQAASKDGNTLIIYEGFRPYEVQQKVVASLSELAQMDAEVNKGITTAPWNIRWFIANSLSNHQRGVAMDVSLGKVLEERACTTGDYSYREVTDYEEYEMPTKMHELSIAAVAFQSPVSSKSDEEWRNVPLSSNMNEPAILLQQYCTGAGLSPLASEWWHFNDLEALESARQSGNSGNYYLSTLKSRVPKAE